MKKIILLILLIPINLNAFSEYQDEKFEDNNLIWEEKEFCYKEEEIFEYLEKSEFHFDNYDLEDYKISYGEWQKEFDNFQNYEEREKYYYQIIEEIRYLHFTQFKSPDNQFMLNELNIMYGNSALDYEFICSGCHGDASFNNGINYNENFHIQNGGELIIDLGDYYPVYSIYVKLYFSNLVHGENAFRLETSVNKTAKSTWTYSRTWYAGQLHEYRSIDFNLATSNLDSPTFKDPIESETLRPENKFVKSYSEKEYREIIYLYKNYEYKIIEVEKEDADYCKTMYRYQEKEITSKKPIELPKILERKSLKIVEKEIPVYFTKEVPVFLTKEVPIFFEPKNLKLGKTEWIQLEQKKTNHIWYWFVPPVFWSALRINAKN